jgi:osomolarity two-component system response regulator SSK1
MEWGCMQALIDFDGWRKWKDFSQQNNDSEKGGDGAAKGKLGGAAKKKKNRTSLGSVSAAPGGAAV